MATDSIGYDYRTVPITAAALSGTKKWARKRERELAILQQQGWEVVTVAPRQFFSSKDHVTLRRRKGYRPRRVQAPAQSLWEQITRDLWQPGYEKRLLRRLGR